MRPIVTDRVAWSVGRSVTLVRPAKTAEPIEMPFGLWARLGPRNHVTNGSQQYICVLKFLLPLMIVRLFILWLLVTLTVELTLKCMRHIVIFIRASDSCLMLDYMCAL